jgi:predicted MFS family arabinose efflux permease
MRPLYAVLGLAGIIAVAGVRHEFGKHHPAALVWRWLTGVPYHGDHYTNATWFRRATMVHHSSGRVMPWWHLPRIYRTGHRTTFTSIAVVTGYGLAVARSITVFSLECFGGVAAIGGLIIGIRAARKWHHDQVVVSPLAAGLAPLLALPPAETQRNITLSPRVSHETRGGNRFCDSSA